MHVAAERPLEEFAELDIIAGVPFEHIVRKWDLLIVVQREKADLSMRKGKGR